MKYILVLSLVVSGSLYPRKAQAMAASGGTSLAISALFVVGAISLSGSGAAVWNYTDEITKFLGCGGHSTPCRITNAIIYGTVKILAVALILAGFVALEGEGGSHQMAPLTVEQATKFGITEQEMIAFNDETELAKTNTILQSGKAKLDEALMANPDLSFEEQVKLMADYMNDNVGRLSQTTLTVLNKIRQGSINLAVVPESGR